LSSTTENARSGTDAVRPFLDPLAESAALIEAGRAGDVVARCEALLAAGRGGALTRLALARALLSLGRTDEALAVLREATLLAPSSPDVAIAMGEALAATGALPTAIAEFQRALRLDPASAAAHLHIAQLWLDAGEPDKAAAEIAAAENLGAEPVLIAARRAAIGAQRLLSRSSAPYVRHLFDQFAADYDERMRARLGYSAPETLRDLCGLLLGPPRKALSILDLGCGTGLSGVAFADFAARLIGVDLSPGMLAKARSLSLYDELLIADVEELPGALTGFDVVVAADVLVYLGDLAKVFAQVRARINAQGLWAFTTEKSESGDFALGPKRRYRHSETYLRRLAAAHGFEVASLIECATRHEAGIPVPTLAAILRRA